MKLRLCSYALILQFQAHAQSPPDLRRTLWPSAWEWSPKARSSPKPATQNSNSVLALVDSDMAQPPDVRYFPRPRFSPETLTAWARCLRKAANCFHHPQLHAVACASPDDKTASVDTCMQSASKGSVGIASRARREGLSGGIDETSRLEFRFEPGRALSPSYQDDAPRLPKKKLDGRESHLLQLVT